MTVKDLYIDLCEDYYLLTGDAVTLTPEQKKIIKDISYTKILLLEIIARNFVLDGETEIIREK